MFSLPPRAVDSVPDRPTATESFICFSASTINHRRRAGTSHPRLRSRRMSPRFLCVRAVTGPLVLRDDHEEGGGKKTTSRSVSLDPRVPRFFLLLLLFSPSAPLVTIVLSISRRLCPIVSSSASSVGVISKAHAVGRSRISHNENFLLAEREESSPPINASG